MERNFRPNEPDRLYVADITQHRTGQGWFYLAVVIDCFSRRVVGWAMADHLRSELVVDALQMAIWNRRPAPGAIHHRDHGTQYTSWSFGHRLREAGLLGSMGSIEDCFDNSVAKSFFATLQTELLDRRTWPTRADLANAMFAFIEGFYNPRRRHSTLGYLSPAQYENQHQAGRQTRPQHDHIHQTHTVRGNGALHIAGGPFSPQLHRRGCFVERRRATVTRD